MPTTRTIMWRKAPTPGHIPLCVRYSSELGTSAPQWNLFANDCEKRTADTFLKLVKMAILRRWQHW